jgi:hypothetical protein
MIKKSISYKTRYIKLEYNVELIKIENIEIVELV